MEHFLQYLCMIGWKGVSMKKRIPVLFLTLLMACTVNYYDQSTHHSPSAGKVNPDTVYLVPEHPYRVPVSPSPHVQPDTVRSRRLLVGGGVVEIQSCGSWTRYELRGCSAETEGVFLEIKPVVTCRNISHEETEKSFELIFQCTLQPHMAHIEPCSAQATALPVITGRKVLSIIAGNTDFPFLEEEASHYESARHEDGTLSYTAVYSCPQWKLREIILAEEITALSESPEFKLMFSDNSRRLFQQFYDIFVIHDGDAPVLPVTGAEDTLLN
ncbi:hypothetical protein CSA37_09265 [Candidatus Fermentibacteria bacterium]|nr:MAG: hypothetical protein CSA37_09265 [Candidatus Fermentibacteria bacterium]